MRILLILMTLLLALQSFAQVKVKGYYRKDGTYVRPHYRSSPDGNPYNNWSYPGNTNPYTGKTATGNPDTYLKNYYQSANSQYSSTSSHTSTTYSIPPSSNYNSSITSVRSNYSVAAITLPVRSGPSLSFTVVDRLTKGTYVKVIANYSDGWKKVQYIYYDFDSSNYLTKTGYVQGLFNSPNPYFINSSSNQLLNNNTKSRAR